MKKLLGLALASALVLGACGGEDQNKKDDREKTKNSTSKKNDKNTDKKNIKTPDDNTVYGKLTKKHEDSNVVTVDDITYILGDNSKILQAEKEFSNLPLDKNTDKNFLNEHAKDLMTKDAELVSNISDTEQKYHSKSLNKDYYVTVTLNEERKVKSLIVSSFK
ncbi:TPA: hypothetical protein ACOT7X_002580 [Staphylococcus aureus]